MANKFETKEWIDRQSQFPSRRRFTPTEIENVFEVERVEGEITEIGNAFDETNMNGLELRIKNGFDNLDSSDIKVLNENSYFTATKLEGVLNELFTYASNGKTAIANAIRGIAASSTFNQLANAITSGKTAIANAIGQGSANDTFATLSSLITNGKGAVSNAIGQGSASDTFATQANYITTGKGAIANAIGQTPGGTPTVNSTFAEMASLISLYKKNYKEFNVDEITEKTYSSGLNEFFIPCSFGYVPAKIIMDNFSINLFNPSGTAYYGLVYSGCISRSRPTGTLSYVTYGIDKITANGFYAWIYVPSTLRIVFGYKQAQTIYAIS